MLGQSLQIFVSRAEGHPCCVAGPVQTLFKLELEDGGLRTLYANGVSVCTLKPTMDGYLVRYASDFPRFRLRVYHCTQPNEGHLFPRNTRGEIFTKGPLVLLVKIPIGGHAECVIIPDETIFELCEGLLPATR